MPRAAASTSAGREALERITATGSIGDAWPVGGVALVLSEVAMSACSVHRVEGPGFHLSPPEGAPHPTGQMRCASADPPKAGESPFGSPCTGGPSTRGVRFG